LARENWFVHVMAAKKVITCSQRPVGLFIFKIRVVAADTDAVSRRRKLNSYRVTAVLMTCH
jgi:hypothetical protein